METPREVLSGVLKAIAKEGMLKGGTIAVDATTRRPRGAALDRAVDTGERWDAFLKRLAIESAIETPTREQLAELDKRRKKTEAPTTIGRIRKILTPIGKMRDGHPSGAKGRTRGDLETGAVLAVTLEGAGGATPADTVIEAALQLAAVARKQSSA